MYYSGKTFIVSTILLSMMASPAVAARYTATNANYASVFATAGAGDTITLTGAFGRMSLSNRNFSRPLLIDASRAQFNGTLDVRNVTGLTFRGGTFGSTTSDWQNPGTVRVDSSRNISFRSVTMIADGLGAARGITFRNSSDVRLLGSNFTGFRVAAGFSSVTNGLAEGNRVMASTSDGFMIVDSHFITAQNNSCSGHVPSPGAHADCIQMWSIAGQPVQSDIRIIKNKAYGRTQGFTSFDPARGGGLRFDISNNYVNILFPNGIACHACVDSRFTGNIVRTAPGARYQTRISIVGGSNNVIANNDVGPGPKRTAGLEARAFAANAFTNDTGPLASGVPEPLVWAQLVTGLALTGAALRRRQAAGSR